MDFLSLTLNKGNFNEAYINEFQKSADKTQNNSQDDTIAKMLSKYKDWASSDSNRKDASMGDYIKTLDKEKDEDYKKFLGLEKSNNIQITNQGTINSLKSKDNKLFETFDNKGNVKFESKTDETDAKIETTYDKNGNKSSETKIDKDNKKLSEIAYKDDKKVSETTYKDGEKVSTNEYDKDKLTKKTEYDKEKGTKTETNFEDGKVTIRTFNKNNALTSAKTGKTEDEAQKGEDLTKAGTARKNDNDVALLDKEYVTQKIEDGDSDIKKLISGKEIKDKDGKNLNPEQIKEEIKNGNLEVYQNEDGKYSLESKKEPKEGKETANYKIEDKKDFFAKMQDQMTEAIDSGDFSKMMPMMFMMQMFGGMMGNSGGMNAIAQMLGKNQEQTPSAKAEPQSAGDAWGKRGVVSFFDGSFKQGRVNSWERKRELAEENGDYESAAKYSLKIENATV